MSEFDHILTNSLNCLLGTRKKIQEQKEEVLELLGSTTDQGGSEESKLYEGLLKWEKETEESIEMVQKALIAEGDEKEKLFQQILENAIQSQKKATEKAEKAKAKLVEAERNLEATYQ